MHMYVCVWFGSVALLTGSLQGLLPLEYRTGGCSIRLIPGKLSARLVNLIIFLLLITLSVIRMISLYFLVLLIYSVLRTAVA